MTQSDIQNELGILLAQLDDMQSKAEKLIAEIEARPFQQMCREKGTTPAEVLAGLEATMSAEELSEAQHEHRELMKACDEQVRRELGLPDPQAQKTVRRAPRRMI